MYKQKGHKGAQKRFLTTCRSYKFRHSGRAHLNTKLSMKKKRQLRSNAKVGIHSSNFKSIKRIVI